jgi:hypothetical protein
VHKGNMIIIRWLVFDEKHVPIFSQSFNLVGPMASFVTGPVGKSKIFLGSFPNIFFQLGLTNIRN